MPLVFSPLGEDVLDKPPRKLLPRHAFLMRQLGNPPDLDIEMTNAVTTALGSHSIQAVDADASTGSKDYLERILGLIRSTGFTVAIFSHKTRSDTLANIALELGFAAMCGKPLIIVKSEAATAPSDLKRTDWINYGSEDVKGFERKLAQAVQEIDDLVGFEDNVLGVALEAQSMDCAVAFERANKGFLLSGNRQFITSGETILERLEEAGNLAQVDDLERLRREVKTFLRQALDASPE